MSHKRTCINTTFGFRRVNTKFKPGETPYNAPGTNGRRPGPLLPSQGNRRHGEHFGGRCHAQQGLLGFYFGRLRIIAMVVNGGDDASTNRRRIERRRGVDRCPVIREKLKRFRPVR